MNWIDIAFASLLANHLLFFRYLGLAEWLENSRPLTLARTVGLALLLLVAASVFWVVNAFALVPWHLGWLQSLLLLASVGVASLVALGGRRLWPQAWPSPKALVLHSFLVGGTVVVGGTAAGWPELALASVAVAAGYGVATVLLDAVAGRLARERIPVVLQGLPMQLITLGLAWLVLHGLGFAFAGKAS